MSEQQTTIHPESVMSCEESLGLLAKYRRDNQIVISNQMSARVWPALSRHELDFNYLSSTMGGAIPLGLGLSLARPDFEVIVLSGDGSLLMNLGSLVTVTASGAKNLTIVLLDNGMYEVTGGQKTPGRQSRVDYAALARAAGFVAVAAFAEVAAWREYVCSGWVDAGPRFLSLRVLPVAPETPRCSATRVDQELRRLRAALLDRVFLNSDPAALGSGVVPRH